MKYLGALLVLLLMVPGYVIADTQISSYLPNSLSFEVANKRTHVQLGLGERIEADNRATTGDSGGLSQLGNSLSLTKMSLESKTQSFSLDWTPIATFAFANLKFHVPTLFLDQTDYQLFRVSIGYGPELTWYSGYGNFYANVSPGLAYSWLAWSSPLSGGSMAKNNINLALSVGYYKYLAQNWALRFVVSEVFEDTQVWKEALSSSQGFSVPTDRVVTIPSRSCWDFLAPHSHS